MEQYQGISGLFLLLLLAWLFSENRKSIQWRPVTVDFLLQLFMALVLVKLPASRFFSSG